MKKVILSALFLLTAGHVMAQPVMEKVTELNDIDVEEHLGDQIPLDLSFIRQDGDTVKLRDYFYQDKPVLLTLAYYECPMLCTFVLNGLTQSVAGIDYLPAREFHMLTVSIDPAETPELAAAKQKAYLTALNKPQVKNGWDFLVGEQKPILTLARSLGFKYYYDTERDEYAHPAVSFILTEQGVISRYLYGLNHEQQDLKLALLEASQGKIGNAIDKLILFCYHYDPDAKGYVLFAGNVMRIGGVITVLSLGLVLTILWKKENRKLKNRGV